MSDYGEWLEPRPLVTVVGSIDTQRHADRDWIVLERRNPAGGLERQLRIQVRSPLGHTFSMIVVLEGHVPGSKHVLNFSRGNWIRATGTLDFPRRNGPDLSPRTPLDGYVDDLSLRAHTLEIVPPTASTGSTICFEGIVTAPARVTQHPYRHSLQLAAVTLKYTAPDGQARSHFGHSASERIPVVMALHLDDTLNLLRPGNRVRIHGALERVVFQRPAEQVEVELQRFDANWQSIRATLTERELAAAERRYQYHRRHVGRVLLAHCVGERVELLDGSPATLQEARRLRTEHVRERRARQAQASA